MTLCQNSKTKYFGRLFLAFAMLLVGVFITNTSASAEIDSSIIDYYNLNNYSLNSGKNNGNNGGGYCSDRWGTGTTSDNGDTALRDLFDQCGPITFTFASSTNNAINFSTGGGFSSCWFTKESDWGIMYHRSAVDIGNGAGFSNNEFQVNGPSGSNGFSSTTGSADMSTIANGAWHQICFVVDATKTEIYFDASKVFTGVHNNVPNDFIFSSAVFSPAYSYAKFGFIDNLISINRPINADEVSTIYNTGSSYDNLILSITSNDYVMYYGNNPVYTAINTNYNLPVVYNVCDSWEDGKIILKLNNDNASSSEKLLTQCSGTFNFNSGAGSSEMSNTSYFTIENFSSDTILATSANFLSTVYKPLNAKDGYIVFNFPVYQYFDYTKTATTTPLIFQYNVCSDTNFSTSTSKICLRNIDEPVDNPSVYCTSGLNNCSGQAVVELPVLQKELVYDLNASYYDGNGDFQLASNGFFIAYYAKEIKKNWFLNTAELACTPEEWASTNILVNIKCSGLFAMIGITQAIGDSAGNGIKVMVNQLDGVFPFNLPIKIKQCWDDSETKLLPSELDKINILDESGNVKVNLPSEWAENSSITIWGSDVWNATNESNEFFTFARYLSKYLIWGIFILIFYLWGKSLIEK